MAASPIPGLSSRRNRNVRMLMTPIPMKIASTMRAET